MKSDNRSADKFLSKYDNAPYLSFLLEQNPPEYLTQHVSVSDHSLLLQEHRLSDFVLIITLTSTNKL